jgi:hypothetical protein
MEAWYNSSIGMNDPQPEGQMASYIRRRKFLATLLGGAAMVWPLAGYAQQAGKLRTIGFLGPNAHSAANEWVAALAQRLRDVET